MSTARQSPTTAITYELSGQNLDTVVGGLQGSFEIEQVLNIGSQTSGAGSGKVTFNPFSITR